MIRNVALLAALLCAFTNITNAQTYYPTDIGNVWILESEDGTERITYAIGKTDERFDGKEGRILRITTAVLGTTTANMSTFSMQVDEEGIKLHRILTRFGDIFGDAHVKFSPPAIFFPAELELQKTWEVNGKTEINLVGDVTLSNVNEVIAIEDVETPIGIFKDCVKIRVQTKTTAALGTSRSTTYQWLAPDIGPVKFQTDQDIVFALVNSSLIATKHPYDINADRVVNILDLTFVASQFGGTDPKADVNGDGTVNILDLILVAENIGD